MIIKLGKRFVNLANMTYTSEINESFITIYFINQETIRIIDPEEMEALLKALRDLSE
jgi:hypothetical protein